MFAKVFVTCRSHAYATALCGRDSVSGSEISKLLLVPASACLGSTIILEKGKSIYLDNISFWQLGPELRVSIGCLPQNSRCCSSLWETRRSQCWGKTHCSYFQSRAKLSHKRVNVTAKFSPVVEDSIDETSSSCSSSLVSHFTIVTHLEQSGVRSSWTHLISLGKQIDVPE